MRESREAMGSEAEQKRLVATEQAKKMLSAGDVQNSLKIVLQSGCSPYTASATQMLGMIALREGNFADADRLIAQSLKMDGKSAPSPKMACGSAFLQCKYEESEANYRKAIALEPKFHEAWHDLGVAVVSQGKVDECIPVFIEPAFVDKQGVALAFVKSHS